MQNIYKLKYSLHDMKNIFIISLSYAVGFGAIETLMRQIDIRFLSKKSINMHLHTMTTKHQFILTMIWTPMILLHKKINNKFMRCLLFPVNIYACEIIGGNILLHIFNYRAWYYKDKYSLFNGMITLSFYPIWICLYFMEDYFYKKILKN
jgi:hypothetical protein